MDGVLAESVGGAAQDGDGDLILAGGCGFEDHLGKGSDLGFTRGHRPLDERLRIVHLKERDHVGAEARPVGVDVGNRDRRAKGVHGDIARAPAVADNVAAAADLNRLAGAVPSEAAGARAAELKDLGGAVGRPFAGFEREDEVVADGGRGVWPGSRHGATQAFAVSGGTDARHTYADTVRFAGELVAD